MAFDVDTPVYFICRGALPKAGGVKRIEGAFLVELTSTTLGCIQAFAIFRTEQQAVACRDEHKLPVTHKVVRIKDDPKLLECLNALSGEVNHVIVDFDTTLENPEICTVTDLKLALSKSSNRNSET